MNLTVEPERSRENYLISSKVFSCFYLPNTSLLFNNAHSKFQMQLVLQEHRNNRDILVPYDYFKQTN